MVLFIAPVFWRPRFEPGAYRGPQATPPFGGLGVVKRRVKWEIYPSRVVATPLAKLPKTYQSSILPKNIIFILKQSPTQTDRYSGYLVAVPTTRLSQFQRILVSVGSRPIPFRPQNHTRLAEWYRCRLPPTP